MKALSCLILLGLTGCASVEAPTFERVAMETASEPTPTCETGHDSALKDGIVTIRRGQTICVHARKEGTSVVPIAVVSDPVENATIIFRAWGEPGKRDTFLTVHNPFDSFLSYKLNMIREGGWEPEYTSSCAVLSRRFGFEHWPYGVAEFAAAYFKLLPESGGVVCE